MLGIRRPGAGDAPDTDRSVTKLTLRVRHVTMLTVWRGWEFVPGRRRGDAGREVRPHAVGEGPPALSTGSPWRNRTRLRAWGF